MAKTSKKDQAIVDEALERFDIAREAWQPIFDCSREDIEFVDGDDQWTEAQKDKRQNRPCMTFDKLSGAIDQVVGDHLQNKPGLKVVGAEDDDTDTAEIYEGLIRQIESRGTRAYKTGFKFSVKGGYGVWRIRHDYLDAEAFDQDLILDEVSNPFSVLLDPKIQSSPVWTGRYGFVFEDIELEEFKELYPKAKSDVSEDFNIPGTISSWINKDHVRVAEYYRLIPVEKEIGLTAEGETKFVEEFPDEVYLKTRMTTVDKLEHFKLTGLEILERWEAIGKFVPLVPIFGKKSVVDGKMVVRGLVRKAKHAQQLYNMERSNYIETVALQPKQPYLATPKMIPESLRDEWRDMNVKNNPVLLYEPDPEAPGGMPKREPAAQVPSGLVAGLQMSSDDIKATTNIYDASLGARSNETSGRAIRARQQEGDTANYEFTDEFAESIKFTGMIFVDLIPHVYDSQRMIRILGEDDAEKVMEINAPDDSTLYQEGEWGKKNDLSRGKYDIRVRVGQSYTTRRIETSEQLAAIMQQNPEMGMLVYDLYLNSLDLVGGDDAIKRIRQMLIKKGVAEPTEEEREEIAQKGKSPQAQAQRQMKKQAAQLEMANKQADTQKKKAEALSKTVDALSKQAEMQANQGDLVGALATIQRIQQQVAA